MITKGKGRVNNGWGIAVRGMEIERSGAFVLDQLQTPHPGRLQEEVGPLVPLFVVSLVEGWRARFATLAITDATAASSPVTRSSIRRSTIGSDMMMAVRDEQII